jgi:hypothetical protein
MAFMAAIPAWVSYAATAASIAASVMGAKAQNDAARANAKAGEEAALANQKQMDYAAGQELAAGQHEAVAKRKKADLMLSRARAVSAASGGGPLDETLMAGIVGAGETDAGYSTYASTERAKGLQYRGQAGLVEATNRGNAEVANARAQGNASILGSVAKGASSMFSSFAPGPAPGIDAGVSDYTGSFTANGPFNPKTFSGQIYD